MREEGIEVTIAHRADTFCTDIALRRKLNPCWCLSGYSLLYATILTPISIGHLTGDAGDASFLQAAKVHCCKAAHTQRVILLEVLDCIT